jgi:hypothetical protein
MVERARLDLEHTSVKAPVSGVVSKKTVEPGQVVQPGQPLMAIVPLDDIWVTANFKEGELRDIRPGQPVSIKVDAYGREYKGKVDSIAAATGARFSLLPPENATGNFVKVVQRVPVKITFESGQDPDHLLRPGCPSCLPSARSERRGDRGRATRRPRRQPVDRRGCRHVRDVHGDPRHDRGQRVAAPHCGQPLASIDESTWALTSYLVANAIVLPLTGWLANYFGRKRLLLISVSGLHDRVALCGLAPT